MTYFVFIYIFCFLCNDGFTMFYGRMVLTPYGGMQLDKAGNYKKKWNWYFIKGHVHTPPFQPICFALNKQLSCRVMEQVNFLIYQTHIMPGYANKFPFCW